MNWRQKFIVEVVWKYFNLKKYNEYLKRVNDEFYTELQAYLIVKNL